MTAVLFIVALLQLEAPPDTAVVARVGRFLVTVRDLRDSYAFGPAFVRRLPDPLTRHLQFMVYERLLAHHAEAARMDTSLFVRERVAALEEDLAVDQLYRREILDNVEMQPHEKEQALQEARAMLRLRWIHAPTRSGIQRIERELAAGAPFDSLFRRSLPGGVSPSRRSMETTLLKLRRDNPRFAEHVATMRAMETSPPITAPDGFYIVHVDELWQNPLYTETEHARMAGEATDLLRMIKADALAAEYVRTKMAAAAPVIKAQGFDIVRAYLADRGLSRDTALAWKIPTSFMTEAGPQPISASGRFLERPLVTFGRQTVIVRDFARWYDIRQFQIKTSSLRAFNSSIRSLVWRMVQDRLLSQEAYGRGLQRAAPVRRETGEWRIKLLYLAARAALGRSITVSDPAVRERYRDYQNRLRARKGKLPRFEEVRQELFEELFAEKEQLALKQLLDTLHSSYPVHVYGDVLRRLAREVERESDAIDMVIYKPGGTFPRVAYPSIDERWQQFR